LTVRQPWPWALVEGLKDIENRSWPTTRRGWLLLHAGVARPTAAMLAAASERAGMAMPAREPRGVIVGAINIGGMHAFEQCRGGCSVSAAQAAWHWEVADRVRLPPPVAARGALNLSHPTVSVAVCGVLSAELPT
jgi:hypothetical protein